MTYDYVENSNMDDYPLEFSSNQLLVLLVNDSMPLAFFITIILYPMVFYIINKKLQLVDRIPKTSLITFFFGIIVLILYVSNLWIPEMYNHLYDKTLQNDFADQHSNLELYSLNDHQTEQLNNIFRLLYIGNYARAEEEALELKISLTTYPGIAHKMLVKLASQLRESDERFVEEGNQYFSWLPLVYDMFITGQYSLVLRVLMNNMDQYSRYFYHKANRAIASAEKLSQETILSIISFLKNMIEEQKIRDRFVLELFLMTRYQYDFASQYVIQDNQGFNILYLYDDLNIYSDDTSPPILIKKGVMLIGNVSENQRGMLWKDIFLFDATLKNTLFQIEYGIYSNHRLNFHNLRVINFQRINRIQDGRIIQDREQGSITFDDMDIAQVLYLNKLLKLFSIISLPDLYNLMYKSSAILPAMGFIKLEWKKELSELIAFFLLSILFLSIGLYLSSKFSSKIALFYCIVSIVLLIFLSIIASFIINQIIYFIFIL